ncbi:LOW QUALITY PROTEIN: receptor-transporting protein 4 [Peromyscus californicus insignis]|uniref:LOW QUALITY PROTEIN: receptor-transporting protein 4 n=1 Tax=Peromyscus californicus insignis TaxID=564181 RepID=UPI0022A7CDC1|nr:LOW QUALITY PROTEIN: receptor-transporting protein 4 [Peromyscus californicus insignis]
MSFSAPSTWEKMFQELIQEEKPRAKWTFQLDKNILPNVMAVGWRQYQQTGLGRFQCSICNRWWISAQVKILCHMYREPGKSQGRVLMRIFGQRCQKCSKSQFENPEFFTESIGRIMENLINYILQKYYGHGFKKKPSTSNEKPLEKVLLNRPHDTANCEACTLGYHGGCSFAYEANLPKYPSSQPKSHSSCLKMSPSSSLTMSHSSSTPKSHSSSTPKSHSSPPPKSHSSSTPKSHSSSPPKSHSSSTPKSHSSSTPKSHSSSPPKSHSSSTPKSHSSSTPMSHSSSTPMSYSSCLKMSPSSSLTMSHSSPPPKSHSSSPPKSHSSPPPKSHSSSTPKSHSSLPQTRNMYVENRHFEEHRETSYTELLMVFSLAALTFIRRLFK